MIGGIFVMWRLLPTGLSQLSILLLVIISVVLSYRGSALSTVYGTAFIGLALINYLQVSLNLDSIIASIGVFGLVTLITWVKNRFHNTSVGRLEALLLAFIVAQANSIASLWPVSFYNRAIIVGLIFYLFWRIFDQSETSEKLVGHFVFVSFIAILVLGGIVWANFPQLLTF